MFFFIHAWSGQSGKPFAPHEPASMAADGDGGGDKDEDGDGGGGGDRDGGGDGSGGMRALSAGAASDASSP